MSVPALAVDVRVAEPPAVLLPEEAAALLGVDLDELVALAGRGAVPHGAIRGHLRFPRAGLLAFLNRR